MSDDFPIRLQGQDVCKESLGHVEAWLNFETLKAGWFADEQRIVDCTLRVLTPEAFSEQLAAFEQVGSVMAQQHGFALTVDKAEFKINGILAVDGSREDVSVKKQMKRVARKVFVIVGATLELPNIFAANK